MDIFQDEAGNTELSPEERRELIPSLSTRAELNQAERLNIHAARLWAMRRPILQRSDLLTDGFARELHKRMFNQIWRWAGRYRTTEKNLGWEVHRLSEGSATPSTMRRPGCSIPPTHCTKVPSGSTIASSRFIPGRTATAGIRD